MRDHLVKRSKGSWSIILDMGRDPTTQKRKQQWVSVKGTKKAAEERLPQLLRELDTGSAILPNKLTLAQFLDRWLRDYVSVSVRPRTYEGYEQKIRTHIIPALGSTPLTAIQPAHLQGFYRQCLESGRMDSMDSKEGGLSPRTVLHLHRILNEALKYAVEWQLVARNVALAVDPPRAGHKEMQVLDSQGVHKLLEAARDTMYYPLLDLAIYTGRRRSELLGLRWKDVDLDMAALSVVQTAHQLRSGGIVYQEPKTAKGKRQVSLSPTAVLAIRAYKEKVEAERDILGIPLTLDSLVFSYYNGSPMLANTITHAYLKIARGAGLQDVRFHDLRHTHATMMLKANVHPKVVMERLGHSTIAVTPHPPVVP